MAEYVDRASAAMRFSVIQESFEMTPEWLS